MAKRAQTEASLPRSEARGLKQGLIAYGKSMLYWAPVWLPLLVASHFLGRGLVPAWRESQRLEREEAKVHGRVTDLQVDREILQRDRERLVDPVWHERARRSLLDPDRAPLTLADAAEEELQKMEQELKDTLASAKAQRPVTPGPAEGADA